jgi:hypothetical protein
MTFSALSLERQERFVASEGWRAEMNEGNK